MEKLYSCGLDGASIDLMSSKIEEILSSENLDNKKIIKLRFSAEDTMSIWAEELGVGTECRLYKVRRFGRTSLILTAEGKSVNPTEYRDELFMSVSSNLNMVTSLGLPAQYRYTGGRNELKFQLPQAKKKLSPIVKILIAIVAAVISGVILRFVLPDIGQTASSVLISPIMNTIMNILRMISGPLVFLSIVAGITGLGDAASFGKIGVFLTKRFVVMTFVLSTLIWVSVCWLFPVKLSQDSTSGNTGVFSTLLNMILDIIPSDIITPFQSGNALQIIFIAGCFGIGCIFLSEAVSETVNVVNQINAIVQAVMNGISSILPIYVYLCVCDMIINGDISDFSQILVPLLLIYGVNIILPLLYGFYASIRSGRSFPELIHSQLPVILMAFATASAAATFGNNVECCEKKLHIDKKLISFGVPFGQTLFMPGAACEYIILALFVAKQNEIAITPVWLVTMLIVASLLAIASPPIPGGGLSSLVILFTQLGLPTAAVGIGATILTFSDYISTASNVACLQQELLMDAKKLKLLNDKS